MPTSQHRHRSSRVKNMRRPTPPALTDRPPDYRMSDCYLDKSVKPFGTLIDMRSMKNCGISVHVYGGFVIQHRRIPNQPAKIFVYHSDDGYAHCKPVEFNKLPQQTLRDLVVTMTDLQLTPLEISIATGLRISTIKSYLENEQPVLG